MILRKNSKGLFHGIILRKGPEELFPGRIQQGTAWAERRARKRDRPSASRMNSGLTASTIAERVVLEGPGRGTDPPQVA